MSEYSGVPPACQDRFLLDFISLLYHLYHEFPEEKFVSLKIYIIALSFITLLGCASHRQTTIYPYTDAETVERLNVSQIVEANPLGPGEAVKWVELKRTPSSSQHLAIIQTNELLHAYQTHDLTAAIVEGKGKLFIKGEGLSLQRGVVATVPQGTPHYFKNTYKKPLIVFVVFSPAYDGQDKIIVQSPTKDFLQ